MKTTIINFYGGPAAGKSTISKLLYEKMQEMQIFEDVAFVNEFATELILRGESHKLKDQMFVTGGQIDKLKTHIGKAPIIITDSPLQLGRVYSSLEQFNEVSSLIDATLDNTNEINIVIERNLDFPFETYGRVHTLEESIEKDKELLFMLESDNKEFLTHKNGIDSLDMLIENVYEKIRELNIKSAFENGTLIKSSDENYSFGGYERLKETMTNHPMFEGVRFDEVFRNPDYFKENKQGLSAAMVYLTPDEYMSAVELRQKGHTFSLEKVEGIRDFRDAGNKLEAPFLEYGYKDLDSQDDYKHFTQEGYNRAYYMQMMGVKEIPVFIRYREDDKDVPDFIIQKLQGGKTLDKKITTNYKENTMKNVIKVEFQSIWDGRTEILTNAELDITSGKIINIESADDVEDLDMLDSQSIFVRIGDMTVAYDVVENENEYFIGEKDLRMVQSWANIKNNAKVVLIKDIQWESGLTFDDVEDVIPDVTTDMDVLTDGKIVRFDINTMVDGIENYATMFYDEETQEWCARHDIKDFEQDIMEEICSNINAFTRSAEQPFNYNDFIQELKDGNLKLTSYEWSPPVQKNNQPQNFLDDNEKMVDFIQLSREDFLKSYSYLSEADYEQTAEAMENLIEASIEKERNLYDETNVYDIIASKNGGIGFSRYESITKDEHCLSDSLTGYVSSIKRYSLSSLSDGLKSKLDDRIVVDGLIYNMESYDAAGKEMSYASIDANKRFIIETDDRFSTLEDMKITFQDGLDYLRNDFVYTTMYHPNELRERIKDGSLLRSSIENRDMEVIEWLMEKNCNPNEGIELAAKLNYAEGLDMLIKKGADVNLHVGSPLLLAVEARSVDTVKLLLENGANPNIENIFGTPLEKAAESSNFEIVELLLKHGAENDEVISMMETPDKYTTINRSFSLFNEELDGVLEKMDSLHISIKDVVDTVKGIKEKIEAQIKSNTPAQDDAPELEEKTKNIKTL